MSRLTRENVERQLQELWSAVGAIPDGQDPDGTAARDAHRIEADLRGRLQRQERLEAAAEYLLGALETLVMAIKRNDVTYMVHAMCCAEEAIALAKGPESNKP